MTTTIASPYTMRALPADEWHRLAETDLDLSVWLPLAQHATMVVVERDGVIQACWATFMVRHVEGFWIRPEARKTNVFRRLFAGMGEVLRGLGFAHVVTHAETPEIVAMCEKLGARSVGAGFLVPVDDRPLWKGRG